MLSSRRSLQRLFFEKILAAASRESREDQLVKLIDSIYQLSVELPQNSSHSLSGVAASKLKKLIGRKDLPIQQKFLLLDALQLWSPQRESSRRLNQLTRSLLKETNTELKLAVAIWIGLEEQSNEQSVAILRNAAQSERHPLQCYAEAVLLLVDSAARISHNKEQLLDWVRNSYPKLSRARFPILYKRAERVHELGLEKFSPEELREILETCGPGDAIKLLEATLSSPQHSAPEYFAQALLSVAKATQFGDKQSLRLRQLIFSSEVSEELIDLLLTRLLSGELNERQREFLVSTLIQANSQVIRRHLRRLLDALVDSGPEEKRNAGLAAAEILSRFQSEFFPDLLFYCSQSPVGLGQGLYAIESLLHRMRKDELV